MARKKTTKKRKKQAYRKRGKKIADYRIRNPFDLRQFG